MISHRMAVKISENAPKCSIGNDINFLELKKMVEMMNTSFMQQTL